MSPLSSPPAVETSPTSDRPKKSAEARLVELKRALQRQLKRRPTAYEKAALDRAALMTVRAEIAAYDPNASSEDVVRLDNAARRARNDFERIALPHTSPESPRPLLSQLRAKHSAVSP
jgi:hypothetical protein